MDLYGLPEIKKPKLKSPKFPKFFMNKVFWFIILSIFLSSVFGFLAGTVSSGFSYFQIKDYLSRFNISLPETQTIIEKEYIPQTTQEEMIINVVKSNDPAVVSIVATKEVPVYEEYYDRIGSFLIPQYRQVGTEKQEVGGGTGFIVSEDGMILTNKHVVLDEEAEYTVFMNDGKSYPAKVLARDPFQDLAIVKIDREQALSEKGELVSESFPQVNLGDSDSLQMGQTVVAIGNALGEFRNTVSVGVVSGLGRTITASGGGLVETIEDVIQTDAAINKGNSGGPLLNLKGEVIGINTAMVEDAQSISFSIPINKAKRDIKQIKETGKISYAYLGVRYALVNKKVKEENNLMVDYGALILKGENGEPAVLSGSAAEKAGLKEGDIILEFNGEKIAADATLTKLIQKYDPFAKVILKILRNGEEKTIQVTLDEKSE